MENKQYFPFAIKQFDDTNEDLIIKGHAAIFNNTDYGGDIILPGAFKESLQSEHNVKVLWQHKQDEVVGVPDQLYEDEKGLYFEARLPKEDDLVQKRVMPQLRVGSLEMSIGYRVKEREFQNNKRFIKEAELWEISLVSIGMNNKAQITDFKSLEINDLKTLNERELEEMFKNGFTASNSVAKMLVSLVKKANQRDVDEANQREVEMVQELKNIKNKKLLDDLKQINKNLRSK